ncbi:KilA-N domain-containing protein [Burkholderia sp. GAS332]|nr:KilA-N domain-containing protein [Burkholderia sp. GAS332]
MAKKTSLVRADYDGHEVQFTNEAWFNATEAAEKRGKRLDKYMKADGTEEYIAVLMEDPNTPTRGDLIKTKRGNNGGTWLHPDLAVHFARWLDVRFGVWCDRQIKAILSGNHPHFEQRRMRHAAAASNKYLREMVERVRDADGKETKAHHYINECLLVNFVVCGEFASLDRDTLPMKVLDFLAAAEGFSAMLYARGKSREDRIKMLAKFKRKWIDNNGQLPAIALAEQPKLEARTISKQLAATPKRMRVDIREAAERRGDYR